MIKWAAPRTAPALPSQSICTRSPRFAPLSQDVAAHNARAARKRLRRRSVPHRASWMGNPFANRDVLDHFEDKKQYETVFRQFLRRSGCQSLDGILKNRSIPWLAPCRSEATGSRSLSNDPARGMAAACGHEHMPLQAVRR